MAARENQGLQIALIIFVMITIILSVTTFIFFNSYKNEVTKREASDKKYNESQAAMNGLQAERNYLLTKLGYPETDSKEAFEAKIAADIKKYTDLFKLPLPEDQRHYTRVAEELSKTVEGKNNLLAAAKDENDKLGKQLADAQKKFADDVKAREDDKVKAVNNEKNNQDSYTKQVAEISKTKDTALAAISQKDQALLAMKAKTEGDAKKYGDDLRKAQTTIENKQDTINKLTQEEPTVPDGRISWVDQRNDSVFINLGSADGLRRRITFSVYDKNATDATDAVRKGSIEVLSIRGPHLAEARILENTNSDPIVPGDIIYTPIWHPGQTQHFAIAGFIDFDQDGTSDRAKLNDIINYNGGVIDAEMDEKGTVTGKISHSTQYLILGRPPLESEEKQQNAFTELSRDAKTNGVPTIKVDVFLAQIGHSVRTAAEGRGNTSGPRSLRPEASIRDGSKTSGEGFRSRRPPAAKNGGSAD